MNDFIISARNYVKELQEDQPLLAIVAEHSDKVQVAGKYVLFVEYNNEVFSDSFDLEIIIDKYFPYTVPIVKELGGRIQSDNYGEHIYSDRSLCLEIPTRILIDLDKNPSLKYFSKEYIQPFLFGFIYYQKYCQFPFGEYKHGELGLLEYYCTVFKVEKSHQVCKLLGLVFYDIFNSQCKCPCGSGQKYWDCHNQQVNNMRQSKYAWFYKLDFSKIAISLFPLKMKRLRTKENK